MATLQVMAERRLAAQQQRLALPLQAELQGRSAGLGPGVDIKREARAIGGLEVEAALAELGLPGRLMALGGGLRGGLGLRAAEQGDQQRQQKPHQNGMSSSRSSKPLAGLAAGA